MTARPLTLMAVHAHPDDEASMTGGVFARYAAEGVRTVLVTCTDGRCGDGPDGIKPDDPRHDGDAVATLRFAELEEARRLLAISDFEFLGYHDSGMDGWASNAAPGAFWNTPLEEAAERVAELMRRYRPDVVVTYDENGFYGHPDHIQAHRATMAAIERLGADAPAKAYWTTMPYSMMDEFGKRAREAGADWEEPPPDAPRIGLPDDEVTTWIDVQAHAKAKYDALAAHASQPDNKFFLEMGLPVFTELLGTETFVRVRDTTGQPPTRETDLFAGLR